MPFPETPRTLGEHLKRCRLIRGLTLTEAAGLLGVDFTTVHNWENGKTKPCPKHIPAVVRFLGYDPFPHVFIPYAKEQGGLSRRLRSGW